MTIFLSAGAGSTVLMNMEGLNLRYNNCFKNYLKQLKMKINKKETQNFSDKKSLFQQVQGVSQYFDHLGFCNFSASRAPRVKILDIFVEPIQF